MLNGRVRSREEQAFMTVVAPPHQIGGPAVGASDFQDLGVAVAVSDVVALDHQTITDFCTHQRLLCSNL